ncbi:eukaryotic translation initiation factor 2-alpha kinase [Orussus abietinus]|uniref:eukaryotic translation initiation factor 2-alpha kinase n=1 Tax=Orussus abietinus TaxID=222816 RepID=UPI0006257E79|nr:eukaryotic translation initiation factor 2-alpha kinase [Orussus abietinus]
MCVVTQWIFLSLFLCLLQGLTFVGPAEIGQLTFCGSSTSNDSPRSLLFVSTLDGKVSALDIAQNGELQWSLDFNDGPMLSSNIHNRELNNNGQWVRLIPSLNGGLYKFDGENLESIPVSAEQLLHSSFRYSDDLVFSGGKETRSYGVSSITGKILYECNINGCVNITKSEGYVDQEVLIVQRFQQTVRAVEPRTGIERWNFSVGQHDVTLISNMNFDCHGQAGEKSSKAYPNIDIQVIVPEGLVWVVDKRNPSEKLWQRKFDSPIVSIWREDRTEVHNSHRILKEVNLFDNTQWSWGSAYSNSPGIYLGMHDKQLYIQENSAIFKAIEHNAPKVLNYNKFPWQPHPAISTALATTADDSSDDRDSSFKITDAESTTALSVLYNSDYINGNGYYLYSKEQLLLNNTEYCNKSSSTRLLLESMENSSIEDYVNETDDTPVQVIIVSLWYWWKEVVIISITTAVLLNFMLTQRLLNATTAASEAVIPPLIVERHVQAEKDDHNSHEDGNQSNFKSRYLTDFEPIDCLGRGGYGIVFEARNKIDDCNYAIKRIAISNSQDSRERVMREVKALAKLDHHNIVRYFNAWLECPPAGWQEEHDRLWYDRYVLSASDFTSDLSQSVSKPNASVCIDVPPSDHSSVDSARDALELNQADPDERDERDEHSYVVFGASRSNGSAESGLSGDPNFIRYDDASSSVDTTDVSMSSESSGQERVFPRGNEEERSESVVFCAETSGRSVAKEKTSNGRDPSFGLLNRKNKLIGRKSTKMFLYIQMQLCQRLSLREWLKQRSSSRDPHRVVNIFQQIVDAVEYVHLQGLIHRDLKPSNIFFAYDEKIKIGDFGLVTAMTEGYEEANGVDQHSSLTSRNGMHTARVGTHLYMSPEQKNGQVYNYKVDIYSLGIILFELLIPFLTDMERIVSLTNLRKSIYPKDFALQHPAEYNLLRMMLDENPCMRPTTLGIKARPPLCNTGVTGGLGTVDGSRWHFELPQTTRHPSVTSSSSSSESWENVN